MYVLYSSMHTRMDERAQKGKKVLMETETGLKVGGAAGGN